MPDTSTISTEPHEATLHSAERGATVVAVIQAAGRLLRAHETLCQAHGLTGQQFNVLRILRGAERAGEAPLPTMTVGERMIEPEPGITRLMGRLEAKGLVERLRCPADARCVRCALTPAGAAVLAALDGPMDAFHAKALASFSVADLDALSGLLARLLPDPFPSPSSCPA
ncbi:MAG TPA: MarR family transcriptional regulator [Rubricoccaceae bacterium]|jgi:DNA-binding MarR family transcriptional regulator